jgi:hypothetical protein
MGTIRNRSVQDLPAVAQKEIADRYPGYTVVRVVRYNANSDNESYINNNPDLLYFDDSSENSSNYFVELNNDNKAIVLMVGLSGEVSFFSNRNTFLSVAVIDIFLATALDTLAWPSVICMDNSILKSEYEDFYQSCHFDSGLAMPNASKRRITQHYRIERRLCYR